MISQPLPRMPKSGKPPAAMKSGDRSRRPRPRPRIPDVRTPGGVYRRPCGRRPSLPSGHWPSWLSWPSWRPRGDYPVRGDFAPGGSSPFGFFPGYTAFVGFLLGVSPQGAGPACIETHRATAFRQRHPAKAARPRPGSSVPSRSPLSRSRATPRHSTARLESSRPRQSVASLA